ncbi:hypothetical protein M407DRAFT_26334 [Tulasnella calospora MUT 4182]|uniref:Uncharacterized protein n=1 Tax=Tulasnella calospora MUT 4182 TaxID=1051891 RepID=A0A0C3QED3_9AGAM|nr:hypothetical protein M407DRAFT_26334 [Tulasnella calospora MUT 4182]
MSLVQPSQGSLAPSSYEFGLPDLDRRISLSSTPRCMPSSFDSILALGNTPTLANPPPTSSIKIYPIIVAVASGEGGQYLYGVEGDLALVFDELNARTTEPVRVITDVTGKGWDNRPQVRPPNLQSIKSSIEEVGQALAPGDLCYLYIGGHTEMNSDETSFMPLPNGERLHGKVLASWLKSAAASGGIIIAIVDVCHSSAFLRMATVYDINTDGFFYCTKTQEEEAYALDGEVMILSSTQCGQLAVTIDVLNGRHAGNHGFFTWVLFKYLKGLEQHQQADAGKLLLGLRDECARHHEKPLPQLSATRGDLQKLPIGRRPA